MEWAKETILNLPIRNNRQNYVQLSLIQNIIIIIKYEITKG